MRHEGGVNRVNEIYHTFSTFDALPTFESGKGGLRFDTSLSRIASNITFGTHPEDGS